MNFIKQLREMHNRNTAVKEALDLLPSAVCYFTWDGSIKLCNTVMYECYREITGRDLQSFTELTLALDSCSSTGPVVRDGNIFLFPDGCARQYSIREIHIEDGRIYTACLLSDVTELYEKRRELEKQSEELKKMYAELKNLSGQLLEVTREQEILNMKAYLHDQMNMGIAAIRQVICQEAASEDNALAIARFRRAARILQEENTYPQDGFSEFIRDAEVAGIRVIIDGKLPEKMEEMPLLIAVLREACVNAARHADATLLQIALEETENTVILQITNDGMPPKKEIVLRGGLADLGKRIRKAGGTMKICSLPEFVLIVTLPVSKQEKEEGTQG